MRLFKRKPKWPPVFTGNCMVLQTTGDGTYVGRCYYSTFGGRCHIHGDVSPWLEDELLEWPYDWELRK